MRNALAPIGYAIKHTPRHTGKGGGVAIIYKSRLSKHNQNSEVFNTFEHIEKRENVNLPHSTNKIFYFNNNISMMQIIAK